ncbi:MAG: biotin/lipoyl-binding protein [Methyloprofundus sp.]|nr:biotin/lipoyl-binding protein [Methyloprofundus sp.]
MTRYLKYLPTIFMTCCAIAAVSFKYWDYITNPWTRNGQVMSYVIQVTPRVTGPIINLPIKDNQLVKAGDLLFEIDPSTFIASLDQAQANYDQTLDDLVALEKQVEAAKASVAQFQSSITEAESKLEATHSQLIEAKTKFQRNRVLVAQGTISKQHFDDLKMQYEVASANKNQSRAALLMAKSAFLQSQANLAQAQANLGASGVKNARLRAAKALVEQAQLKLKFTHVLASVDSYVTNLSLQLGSQAVANQPALALVDANNFWVYAYFRETLVGNMRAGDSALVTLMGYPNTPISGKVNSLGRGIAQADGSTGYNLLPNVNPTFEWIRLAQRIPVRIQLDKLPEGVELRIGTTASVLVMTAK